jgi:hypothetical protein
MTAVTVFRPAHDPNDEKPEQREVMLRYLRAGVLPTRPRRGWRGRVRLLRRIYRAHVQPGHLLVASVLAICAAPLVWMLYF